MFVISTIVIYKSKYGSTKQYAEWIAEELNCKVLDAKNIGISDILNYNTIIYGGGLYAETIAGVTLLTKNRDKLKDKKLIVFTTGITPIDCRDYYDKLVIKKNFGSISLSDFKIYNFPGKMVTSELSFVHRTAIKTLKKIMSDKDNPTEMEKLLIELCDADGDFTDKRLIKELVQYARS